MLSLISLLAFKAAARHLSFSQAVQELFVAQNAVSHHIRKLESDLGVTLFERLTRAVALTAAGQAHYAKVHVASELPRQGTKETLAPLTRRIELKAGLLVSFATCFLVPRLQAFSLAYPDIDLQLRPDIAMAHVSGGGVDVAIRYGRGWPGVRAQRAMSEHLSVICAPSLLTGSKRPRKPRDLLRYRLLTSQARRPFE